MKTIHYLFLLLLLTACLDEEASRSHTLSIQLVVPQEYPAVLDFEQMKVTLTNQSGRGITYTSPCSPTGFATFRVESGEYTAAAHYQTTNGMIFNGSTKSILLLSQTKEAIKPVKLLLAHSKTHALVIKEIYYGGCKEKNGKKYIRDQYLTLYNNSDETLYLDGLCVAVIDFQSTRNASPWMLHTNMTRIPVLDFAWQFPGKGTDHPLAPGQENTIATNAVDHTGGTYGHANSVNLSTVKWGFYDENFSDQDIPLGVAHMKLLSQTNSSSIRYQFPTSTLPIMIFSLSGVDAELYVKNPANI